MGWHPIADEPATYPKEITMTRTHGRRDSRTKDRAETLRRRTERRIKYGV